MSQKKCRCGTILHPGQSHKCPVAYRQVSYEDDGDFFTSFVVGAVTDSTLIGGLVGGDFIGAAIGDALFGDD